MPSHEGGGVHNTFNNWWPEFMNSPNMFATPNFLPEWRRKSKTSTSWWYETSLQPNLNLREGLIERVGGGGVFSSNFFTSMNILMPLSLVCLTNIKALYLKNLANHIIWMRTHFISVPDSHSASLLLTFTPPHARVLLPSVWETFFPFLLPQFWAPVSSHARVTHSSCSALPVCLGGRGETLPF